MRAFIPALFAAGAAMTLAGAAVYITGWRYAPYVYTAGAVLVALAQMGDPVRHRTTALRRLRVQQVAAALLLIVAGALMFLAHGNEWIACLTIAAVMELYTSIRIPQEEKKAEEGT